MCVCFHQGKTAADQAQGDSELATYLSTQQHTSAAPREDLETAVWGAHTLIHTHSVSLDSAHTRSGDEAGREKCNKNKVWSESVSHLTSEERTASAHSSTAVEILMVNYLFVFIYSYSIYWLSVEIDCMTNGGSGCNCTLSSRLGSWLHLWFRGAELMKAVYFSHNSYFKYQFIRAIIEKLLFLLKITKITFLFQNW